MAQEDLKIWELGEKPPSNTFNIPRHRRNVKVFKRPIPLL